MRRFRLRRLEKVNAEALLIAAGQNVKRLLAFRGRGPGKIAQAAALRPPGGSRLHLVPDHRLARRCVFQRAGKLRPDCRGGPHCGQKEVAFCSRWGKMLR